jgi:probable selenium-dependent hydroxylase accessory protein yqeC
MKNNIQYKNLSQQDIADSQCDVCSTINQLCKGDEETGQALLFLLERISRGVLSVIGSGGKTSLIQALSLLLSKKGRVLITTTTHIFPFSYCENILVEETDSEEAILSLVDESFRRHPILCVGVKGNDGKLTKAPILFSALEKHCDYILVEADGSKRLPAKAHNKKEPQIPEETKLSILVFGASALGKPIEDVVHRVELFQGLFTPPLKKGTVLSKEILAEALQKENLGDLLFLNQADCIEKKKREELRSFLEKYLHKPVILASLLSLHSGALC